MTKPNNIFFYNPNCETSKRIYNVLLSTNLLPYFSMVDTTKLKQLPPHIAQIPALLIYNIKKILYGNKIFEFINTMLQPIQPIEQTTPSPNISSVSNTPNSIPAVIGYLPNEMNGFSDKYTFSSENITVLPQHSFVSPTESIKIYTGNHDSKINSSTTMTEIRQLKDERTKLDNEIREYNNTLKQDNKFHEKIREMNKNIDQLLEKYTSNHTH